MKRSKVELSVDISLNDSDDAAFIFQSPTQKRKMKPASPKVKRRKPDLKEFLTRSATINMTEPTLHLNQTAPEFSGDAVAPIENKQNSDTFGTNNSLELGIPPITKTVRSSTSVITSKKPNSASTSFSKNSFKANGLLCPLCKKKFENSCAHVSHMKQCAKKKKISTTQLLKAIDQMKAVPENSSDRDTISIKPSTSGIQKKMTVQDRSKTSEDLALAAALSISLDTDKETIPKLAKIDKTVVDSQRATLEKFGFTSSSSIAITGNRRGKLNLKRMTALKSRTAEERMQILTEKAAVILLADAKETEQIETNKAKTTAESTSEQPGACEKPKLWEIGCTDLSDNWIIDDLKKYITVDEQERIPTPPLEDTYVEYFSPIKLNCSAPETRKTTTLTEDWCRLVGSSLWSDGTIKTLDGEVHIHSLVLNVRCPNIDIECLKASCCDIKKSSLLIVLKYIYTGDFDKGKAQLDEIKVLSNIFNRPELLDFMTEKVSSDSLSEVASTSATTPKQVQILKPSNFNEAHLSEADTVPVTLREGNTDDDFIDLTQSGHTSTASDSEDPTEKSYWRKMRQNNELDDRLDIIDKEREIAKIRSFFEKNKPENTESDDDYIMDSRERDKIINLSQGGGGDDHFDSNDNEVEVLEGVESRERQNRNNVSDTGIGSDLFDNDVQVLSVDKKKVGETVTVSSDSEDPMFAASTDDETSNHAANANDFNLPYFESPPNNDFIDYNRTAALDTTPPSQSFIAAAVTPRTPLKVLESPIAVRSTPRPTRSTVESPDFITESPENDVEVVSNSIKAIPGHSAGASVPRTFQNNETTPKGTEESLKRRIRPQPQAQPNHFLRRSLLAAKARARRSLLTNINTDPIALSESVVTGLDESWHVGEPSVEQEDISSCITPIRQGRKFLEVTPRLTPSTKLVNRVTPRPSYTSMKTGSLKKQLQRFGLKQSLGKVKARKILRHIYDELHPYMNTRTGKFLKILPEDDQNKRKVVRKRASPKKKNAGKSLHDVELAHFSGVSPNKESNKTNEECTSTVFPKDDQHKILREGTRVSPRKKNVGKSPNSTETLSNDCPESAGNDSTLNDSCSTVNVSEEESDIHDDDVLTQSNTDFNGLSTDDILIKIFRENKDLYRKILEYEPIRLESFLKEIKITHKVKISKGALVDFCDKHCLVYKSEVDAANAQRRNVKRKVRTQKRKEKAASSASQ